MKFKIFKNSTNNVPFKLDLNENNSADKIEHERRKREKKSLFSRLMSKEKIKSTKRIFGYQKQFYIKNLLKRLGISRSFKLKVTINSQTVFILCFTNKDFLRTKMRILT